MYAIYVMNVQVANIQGWLKDTKRYRIPVRDSLSSKDDMTVYTPSVEPVIAKNISQVKTWKRENSAINFAERLANKLKRVYYNPNYEHSYNHVMPWNIVVKEVETGRFPLI